ncbi:hypothetical protein Lal_00012097 [Lupinus albus]|nr:hypothetical protein Lal_00012097 [Lupinus albus]
MLDYEWGNPSNIMLTPNEDDSSSSAAAAASDQATAKYSTTMPLTISYRTTSFTGLGPLQHQPTLISLTNNTSTHKPIIPF